MFISQSECLIFSIYGINNYKILFKENSPGINDITNLLAHSHRIIEKQLLFLSCSHQLRFLRPSFDFNLPFIFIETFWQKQRKIWHCNPLFDHIAALIRGCQRVSADIGVNIGDGLFPGGMAGVCFHGVQRLHSWLFLVSIPLA